MRDLFGSHSQSNLQTEGAIFVVPSVVESIPSSAAELVDIAMKKFKDYGGDVEAVDAYDKRPGGSVGSAVLIGLQVGGNLPAVLESTASTIREMNRLDGVVKTKTSEGKAQLWVLAVFPFAICLAFSSVQKATSTRFRKRSLGTW